MNYDSVSPDGKATSGLFKGIVIHVNGYTQPSALELKVHAQSDVYRLTCQKYWCLKRMRFCVAG
jgi:hypothetical protein